MSPIDALRVARRVIAANRLRSGLTALGLIIGVGSVIVLIAVGQGAQEGVAEEIRGLGSDLVFVVPGNAETAGGNVGRAQTLVLPDAAAIEEAGIAGVAGVAGQLSFTAQAIGGGTNQVVTVVGTTELYPSVRQTSVAQGSFLSFDDVDRAELSIVLGSAVAERLFPGGPVGEELTVSLFGRITFDFEVVGVMQERGGSGDDDNFVFVPVTSLQQRLPGPLRTATGETRVNQINIRLDEDADKDFVAAQIRQLLLITHDDTEDFTVTTQNELLDAATEVSTTLSILLGSVAGISLLVGAIGVMNIMLVSVTERTREIGIRRAVGARGRDIVMQFVTEALALSVGGGLLGIAIGFGIATGLDDRTLAGQQITTLFQPWSAFLAFGVAATIGLIAGVYPAYRATAVDPIAALRNE